MNDFFGEQWPDTVKRLPATERTPAHLVAEAGELREKAQWLLDCSGVSGAEREKLERIAAGGAIHNVEANWLLETHAAREREAVLAGRKLDFFNDDE